MKKYPQDKFQLESHPEYKITGELVRTEQVVGVVGQNDPRTGRNKWVHRPLYQDEQGKKFIKMFGKWWKFPEQVEH